MIGTRERILKAALEVFAVKGYGQASTREICRLAGVNTAAIHYHFGDKASLYRELFLIPERVIQLPGELDQDDTTLQAGLQAWYEHVMSFVLEPDSGNRLRLLFLREQIEPSGLLAPNRAGIVGLYLEQLVRFLATRLEVDEPDPPLYQLAFSLIGMSMIYFVEGGSVRTLAPGLIETEDQVQTLVSRLVNQAQAAVCAEHERRLGEK